MMDLSSVSTGYLVEALSHREGVEHILVNNGDKKIIHVEGPARVLVVVD